NMFQELFAAFVAGGVGGFLIWLIADKIFPDPVASNAWVAAYICFATPTFLMIFLLAATVFVGLSSRFTSDADREWVARAGAWILIASGAWVIVSVIVLFGPLLLVYGWKVGLASISVGTLTGFLTLLLGHSGSTQAKDTAQSSRTDLIL